MKKGDIVIALKDVKRSGFKEIEYKKGEEIIVYDSSSDAIWFKPDGKGNFPKSDFILKSEYQQSISNELNYEIY